jgi:hypothetical protein
VYQNLAKQSIGPPRAAFLPLYSVKSRKHKAYERTTEGDPPATYSIYSVTKDVYAA